MKLYPDISGNAILCTVPWVKVAVIIRDPVERLFSHYNFLKDPTKHNRTGLPPFEQVVKGDIKLLQKVGVLPRNLSRIEEHMGTKAEADAYLRYQRMSRVGDRLFIRSLYALQLEGWMRALRRFGKDPNKDMKIVISSDVKRDSNATNSMVEWLGLPGFPHTPKRAMVTKYTSPPINPAFQAFLDSIFAPYNKRLYKLLGESYEGVFDPSYSST